MRDWLIKRKSQDKSPRLPSLGLNQSAIENALASVDMQILPQVDVTQFCIKAAANMARAIVGRARFSLDDLDDDGKLVAALFGLSAGDRLSMSLNAPFEIVSSVVPMDLFGPDYAAELPRLQQVHLRLTRNSWTLKAIGDNISEWIVTPSDQRFDRLATIFVICRRYV
jgi:hypothetical protein